MQATHSGFGIVSQENVFKVCDQPHPLLIAKIVESCLATNLDEAYNGMRVTPRCTSPALLMLHLLFWHQIEMLFEDSDLTKNFLVASACPFMHNRNQPY